MFDRQAECGLELTLQGALQQILVVVYGTTEGRTTSLLRRAVPPERCTLGELELKLGRWHHLLVCFRKRSKALLAGTPEAFAVLDGRRTQATPCAFPSFPARSEVQAGMHVGCHFGACDERRGFEGQLGTVLLLKGCPLDNEAAALFRAGTRCAEPDAVLAAAGGSGLLPSSRASNVVLG